MGAQVPGDEMQWDDNPPPARRPERFAPRPQPQPRPPMQAPPVGRPPATPLYAPHGYTPPPYRPQPTAPQNAGSSSKLKQWQAGRENIPTREQYEGGLERSLERSPGRSPERPGPAAVPVRDPPRRDRTKSHWPVVKSVAIIITVVVILSALQVQGEMGAFRTFLDRDLSKGLPVLRVYPVSSEFKMNRVMSTTCRGPELSYTAYIGIPVAIPGQQNVVDISKNPDPTTTSTDFWTWSGTAKSGQTVSVVIGYHIKATLYQWNLDSQNSGSKDQIPASYSSYLGDEWKFTPSDPTIQKLAADLAGGTNNTFDKVDRIYSYIHENIAYQVNSPAEPKEPTQTLADKAGDCDDQSFLLGSLLRAQGVPAWLELGLLYDQSRSVWGAHAWLRLYIPLRNGGGDVAQIDPANDEFLFRDAFRMTDYVDDGNGDHLQNYYISWRFVYSGSAPLRNDRFDTIYYHPGDNTVTIATSGPGAGQSALGNIWQVPGFDAGTVLLAGIASVIILGVKRRRHG